MRRVGRRRKTNVLRDTDVADMSLQGHGKSALELGWHGYKYLLPPPKTYNFVY